MLEGFAWSFANAQQVHNTHWRRLETFRTRKHFFLSGEAIPRKNMYTATSSFDVLTHSAISFTGEQSSVSTETTLPHTCAMEAPVQYAPCVSLFFQWAEPLFLRKKYYVMSSVPAFRAHFPHAEESVRSKMARLCSRRGFHRTVDGVRTVGSSVRPTWKKIPLLFFPRMKKRRKQKIYTNVVILLTV